MNLLHKLLWKSKNKQQLLLAALGATLGLFLLLSAIQFYADFRQISDGKQGGDQFVLVNKKVNLFHTVPGVKSSFTAEEIEKIRSQDFVLDLAQFTPNQYKVSASSSTLGFFIILALLPARAYPNLRKVPSSGSVLILMLARKNPGAPFKGISSGLVIGSTPFWCRFLSWNGQTEGSVRVKLRSHPG